MKIGRGQWLFREGDASQAMYLIKSGRMAITKTSQSTNEEIVLAERINGQLIGEMSFFDGKPRSAGAKAMTTVEVIELPFSTLQEQFDKFPPWIKVMIKTINNQLRDANTRIRNLENIASDTKDKLLPHTLLRIMTMISLVGYKSEQSTEDGPVVPYKDLHLFCTQIFHQPTHKLNRALKGLQKMELVNIDENDEAQNVVLKEHQVITDFATWYQQYLGLETSKQTSVEEKELSTLQAIVYYGQEADADDDGFVKVNLNDVQKNARDDLGVKFNMTAFDNMASKGLFSEKIIEDNGVAVTRFKFDDLAPLSTYWTIVHTIQGDDISDD